MVTLSAFQHAVFHVHKFILYAPMEGKKMRKDLSQFGHGIRGDEVAVAEACDETHGLWLGIPQLLLPWHNDLEQLGFLKN